MQKLVEGSIRTVLDDAIRNLVAVAVGDGSMARARADRSALLKIYFNSGLSRIKSTTSL